MELLIYIFGNWCAIGAALILIWHYYEEQIRRYAGAWIPDSPRRMSEEKNLMVSRDTQIMLALGSVVRVYWSCSPPPIWSTEETPVALCAMLDIFLSPVVWGATVYLVGMKQTKFLDVPLYLSWPVLSGVTAALSIILPAILSDDYGHNEWPMSTNAVVFNMSIEAMAMVPQMWLIAYSKEQASPKASHFVGLLCVARVFRIIFWIVLLAPSGFSGAMWEFVAPDLIHTIIMGDYLFLWIRKVRADVQRAMHSVEI